MVAERFRPWIVIAGAAMGVLAVRLAVPAFAPRLLVNTTPSEPYGLYAMKPHPTPEYVRGMRVVLPVPPQAASMVMERRWLAPGVPLIKEIGALAGDRVCVDATHATINGESVGPVFEHDSLGRPLPQLRGCVTVPAGHFFPLSRRIPNSFDGRYIGIQPLASIEGEARAVWIF